MTVQVLCVGGPDVEIRSGDVLQAIGDEMERQLGLWGEQHHPDGSGDDEFKLMADEAKELTDRSFSAGTGTWAHILTEEFLEALAESDPEKIYEELVQVAAVASSWARDINTRPRNADTNSSEVV